VKIVSTRAALKVSSGWIWFGQNQNARCHDDSIWTTGSQLTM